MIPSDVGTTTADTTTAATAPGATTAVTVRYFAAAKAATGVTEEQLDLPGPTTLAALLDVLRDRHPAEFGTVLQRCSFLVDEVSARPETTLAARTTVDILPPFAGG